jgi:hypothetical protein
MTNDVIKNMSASVRAKAEAYAAAKGITLEEAVTQQMSGELTEADLDSVAGGIPPGEYNFEGTNGVEQNTEVPAQ